MTTVQMLSNGCYAEDSDPRPQGMGRNGSSCGGPPSAIDPYAARPDCGCPARPKLSISVEVPLARLAGLGFYTPRKGWTALGPDDLRRIEEKVRVMPNGCWQWTSPPTPEGYGQVWFGGTVHFAHHLLSDLVNGPPSPGQVRGHRCHDMDLSCAGGRTCPHRRCINPSHIVLQTLIENLDAGRPRGRKRV